jgi:nucleotide-binding universal stress UspA family protein
MLGIKTILHATDFSPQAEAAFHLACALARDYGARRVILHVWSPAGAAVGEFGYVMPPDPVEEKAALRAQLASLGPDDPSLRVERQIAEGDPVVAITELQTKTEAPLGTVSQ